MAIFINQKLTVILIAKDSDGEIVDLTGHTVHFLVHGPSGNVAIDESPTIADSTNGQVAHVHVVGELNESGDWMDKLLIDGDEVPSTRYVFHVYERWQR